MKKILTIFISIVVIGFIFYGAQSIVKRFDLNKNNDDINTEQDIVIDKGDVIIGPEVDDNQEQGLIEKVLGVVGIQKEEPQAQQGSDAGQVETDDNIVQEIKIRIIKEPLGEEPNWVKQVWIGLEIPVIKGSYSQKGGQEVISKAFRAADNYVTHVDEALAILKAKNPEAEKWWRDNVDLVGVDYIAFDQSVCELIIPK